MQILKTTKFTWGTILFFLTLPLFLLTIFGFLGRFWWIFDLACHFRVQYFVLLALSAILFTVGKKWKPAIIVAIFALINLSVIIPYSSSNKIVEASKFNIRSLSLNLDFRNSSYAKTISLIKKTQPDLLILEELSEKWEKALKNSLSSFPYSTKFTYFAPSLPHWAENIFEKFTTNSTYSQETHLQELSVALYSRFPLEDIKVNELDAHTIPYVKAGVTFKEKRLILLGVHLYSPVSKDRFDMRNRQLSALAKIVNKLNQPVILVGDFNTTPWSSYFKDFIQKTGLKESRRGFGVYPTWPARFAPLRIPIDHSLTSKEISIKSFSLGQNTGSDHYPIILDFSID
jgi:endonuclease/exonuclease/phosphatase (EEP) superfamily protein YafD